ncbi:histidine phosphatase family protein [Bermanella sp. R86510]|uniref:histidine phosphatase family protein n=1 Tax=unclassified Bermanella TaxID=2627862 RepID=UPI0037CC9EC5
MKYKLIDIVRHGEPQGGHVFRGHTDHPLTELGWQQLTTICDSDNPPWDVIVSSPLSRCFEFAQWLSEKHDIALISANELKEFHFGVWENQSMDKVFKTDFERIKGMWSDPMNFASPDGESLLNFEGRVLKAWFGCLTRPEQRLLILCHGGVIRIILKEVLGLPFTHINRLDVPYACRSQIQVSEQEPYHYQLKYHG